MKKKVKLFILFIICTIFIGGSYLRVEILTALYGNQFEELHNASSWMPNVTYFKVMKYSGDKADVYYADLDDTDGTTKATLLYHFKKKDNVWILNEWEIIWTEGGNADSKFMWPYYFH